MGCFLKQKFTNMSEEPIRATTTEKVKAAMKREGRKYTWLAEQLGITRVAMYDRLNDNTWSAGEVIMLKRLLNIG
jgi:transcriptional regulator with PAS, ATPase and Fis domain